MGNQLTALAPAQILPMESYFHDLPDFGKPVSLGSTRFMKVARSKYSDGTEVVVKIFPKIDSSVQLQVYEKRLHDINMRLRFIANVLPYQNFWDSDKAAFLVRQHVQYNLYDRISTRPYLNNIEKKWIVFQLLKALEGCHEKKVYHGDLKTENVLLTGWGWVFLTDFASFKPTLLPADNPADYTFFFDTSRRRSCYVAPERFVHASSYSQSSSASDSFQRNKPLTYEMDVFSLGCVTAELFLDGQLIFNLSELLDYCQKEFSPEPLLKKITDKNIRKMVRHMIQFKASERTRPEQYLTMFKGLVFPEYFYSFLHDYFKAFTTATQLTPDQCIKKLYGDIEAILANLFLNSTKQDRETGYGDVLVIVLSAITSNLRVAQFAGSKLQAIEMMRTIANYVSDCSILERIVPFLHLLIKDKWPSVRAEAIRTLSFCLSVIRKVPRSDFNLFPEYILPVILMVPKDIDVQVRVALAESVAELALSSHRFLELAQLQMNQEAAGDEPSGVQYQIYGTYDNELHQLHETFQSIVVHLLSDNDSNVKRAFLTHSAGKLCTFFGAQKAKEVILSHMITFLNDKSNWELHIAFFEAIVDVVSQIGERSLDVLEALLQQGLSDPEEAVICEAISSMTVLCINGLFNLRFLISSLQQIVPFIAHPNIWARYGSVGFIMAAASQLDDIDALCYIAPVVQPFLKYNNILELDNKLVLLNAISDPIPRSVLDCVMKQQDLDSLFECLAKVEISELLSPNASISNIDVTQQQLYKKLVSLGLNSNHTKQLLVLKEQIFKQHSNKQQSSESDASQPFRGLINLKDANSVQLKSVTLTYEPVAQPAPPTNKRKSVSKSSHQAHLNQDWGLMFSDSVQVSSPSSDSIKLSPTLQYKTASKSFSAKTKDNLLIKQSELTHSSEKIDQLKGDSGGHRRTKSDSGTESRSVVVFDKPPSLVRVEQTTCMENLQSLLNHKKELYKKDMQGMDKGYLYYPFYQAPASWAPKGQLVAHIHDHLQAVNKIKVIPDSTYFVSFSDDSTTKIWDVNKMEGLHVINKPKLVYSQQGGKIKTGCYCMGTQSIVAASSNGTIHAFNIDREPNSKQKTLKAKDVFKWELDPYLHGSIVEMSEMTCGGQNVLAFITTKGHLCGLDLRTPNLAWDLENDPRHGLMLSMALDPFQNWIALGTSLGYHIVWDMRFHLPICNWKHEGHGQPYVHRIQQLSSHPNQLQTVLSAASGNNEISVWDMETATRRQMLWASPTQPFGHMTENPQQHNSVRALHTCVVGNDPVLLTGGTDRFIRLWHLNNPMESSCIVKAGVGSEKIDISYSSQVIEGVEVLRELKTASRGGGGGSTGGDDSTGSHVMSHVDCITSLAVIPYKSPQNLTQQFIISASRDGIIKLWK